MEIVTVAMVAIKILTIVTMTIVPMSIIIAMVARKIVTMTIDAIVIETIAEVSMQTLPLEFLRWFSLTHHSPFYIHSQIIKIPSLSSTPHPPLYRSYLISRWNLLHDDLSSLPVRRSSALTLPRIKRPTSTFDSYWRVHMVGGQFARSPHPIVGIENLNGTHERERERAPLVSNRRFEFLKYIPGSPPVSLLAFCFVPFLIERKIGSSCL